MSGPLGQLNLYCSIQLCTEIFLVDICDYIAEDQLIVGSWPLGSTKLILLQIIMHCNNMLSYFNSFLIFEDIVDG